MFKCIIKLQLQKQNAISYPRLMQIRKLSKKGADVKDVRPENGAARNRSLLFYLCGKGRVPPL